MLQKGLGHLASPLLHLLPVMNYLITKLSVTDNFSACREYLAENRLSFPAAPCWVDTLTYRKDYDRSPIIVGHQAPVGTTNIYVSCLDLYIGVSASHSYTNI